MLNKKQFIEDALKDVKKIFYKLHMESHGEKLKAWNLLREDLLQAISYSEKCKHINTEYIEATDGIYCPDCEEKIAENEEEYLSKLQTRKFL